MHGFSRDERFVSQEADCKKMVDTAVDKFGALHVAFNNAGTGGSATFAEITEETIDTILDINVKSLAWCFKYQVSHSESRLSDRGSYVENRVVVARADIVPKLRHDLGAKLLLLGG